MSLTLDCNSERFKPLKIKQRSKYNSKSDFMNTMSEQNKQRSKAWYLLPIFFGILGGIIGFFVMRHDSPKMARNSLIIGVANLMVGIIIGYVSSLATLDAMTNMVLP